MNFIYEPELLEYMKKKGTDTILVELVEATSSDFEILELSIRLADAKTKEIFVTKKRYKSVPTEYGEVLLPPFPLDFDDTVAFGLKTFLFVRYITQKGISTGKIF